MLPIDQPLEEHSASTQPDHPKESATPNPTHSQLQAPALHSELID